MFYNTIINLEKDGERIDTTYETPSQYKAVNEHRSVFNAKTII